MIAYGNVADLKIYIKKKKKIMRKRWGFWSYPIR